MNDSAIRPGPSCNQPCRPTGPEAVITASGAVEWDAQGPSAAAAPPAPAASWTPGSARLKFLLGEVPLGSVSFPSLILDVHFTALVGGPPEPALPFDRFPPRIAVLKVPSYPVPERLPRLSLLPGAIRYVPSQYQRHYVDLGGTFDAYLGKFSSKSRSTLRRKVRKFAEASGGEIRWREFRRPEEMENFHRLAREVSCRTYQERLLKSGLPELDRFQRELAACPSARGYLLFYGDRSIAYMFCPERNGNLLYQYVGYDPDFQQWSPGTVLLYLAIESLFTEGRYRTFDFTEGEGPHKEFFANNSMLCADIYYFRRGPLHLLLLGAHTGLHASSRALVRALDRVGLKDRIKKIVRAKSQNDAT